MSMRVALGRLRHGARFDVEFAFGRMARRRRVAATRRVAQSAMAKERE
jgi:hypothetical protein